MNRKKILISAFAFSPYRGSECAVGWNIATRLAKHHDVTVLCGDVQSSLRTKKELERYFLGGAFIPNLNIQYVEPSYLTKFLEKIHRLPGLWCVYYLAYRLWQKKAYRTAKRLHANHPYELAHQLNMIGYREPGYLWKLPVPFVWGPVGGSPNVPFSYYSMLSLAGRTKVGLRTLFNGIQKRIAWRSKRAAQKAKIVWAVTNDDVRTIRDIWGVNVEQMLETGTMPHDGSRVRVWDGESRLHIVWSGIHTSRKALPILLHAIADEGIRDNVRVDILGTGPETAAWQRLAARIGVSSCLTWLGMISHQDALERMKLADIMVFTSLKEGTPHVVLEALSLGLPVICHDACGMAMAVTERCGIIIPLNDPKTSIQGFRDAIRAFLIDPERVKNLSEGALRRAEELSWDKKAEVIAKAYETV